MSEPTDPDAPTVLVPRIPGTAVIAIVGGGLILALAGIMALNWSKGTLDDRWIETDPPSVSLVAPPAEFDAPAAVRVQLRQWNGAPIPADLLAQGFGWEPLGEALWRWPAAGPEGAAIITLEGNELEVSPLRADLVETLTAEAESRGLMIEVRPLPPAD